MIKRLEADLETYKDETRKMREGYERKVRRVRVTSAKFRAESEVKLGELKEELASQSKYVPPELCSFTALLLAAPCSC
jgi:hypothetical protein|eukprot:m.103429 g.103429  ORF g.103429 m.103429 type:complete len:78 (-) comp20878_c0_seq4:91-324(-)